MQRLGDFLDIVEGDVAYPPLHMGDEGSMQVAFKCQRLLRKSIFGPQHLHVGRQNGAQRSLRLFLDRDHGHDSESSMLLSQPRLSHNMAFRSVVDLRTHAIPALLQKNRPAPFLAMQVSSTFDFLTLSEVLCGLGSVTIVDSYIPDSFGGTFVDQRSAL